MPLLALLPAAALLGFLAAAIDLATGGQFCAFLQAQPPWPVYPLGAVLLLAGGIYILSPPRLLPRIAIITAPLLIGWIRLATSQTYEGRDVLYDWLLWGHLLLLAVAVCVALATEDPALRPRIHRFWRSIFPAGTRPGRRWWLALLVPALFVTSLMAVLSILRFLHFNAGTVDLGMYDQIHWCMIHYRPFYTTLFEVPWGAQLSRFDYNYHAEHFMPIIAVTTAIYWFHQSPSTLLAIQALAAGAAAFPLYFFALRATGRPWVAFTAGAAWLLHPLLHHGVLNDYHPDALVGFFVFLALLGYESRQVWLYALGLLGAMACKADMAILTLAMGVFLMATHPARWRWGLAATIAGAVWYWGIATPIMQHAVAGVEGVSAVRQLDRFRLIVPEGTPPPRSLIELVWIALANPGRLFALLLEMPRQAGLARLLVPLGLICLLRPQSLILIAPAIGAHIFSAWSMQARFDIYHATAVLPWIMVTTVYALQWLGQERSPGSWLQRVRLTLPAATIVLAITTIGSFLMFSPIPPGGTWDPLRFSRSAMHDATVELVQRVKALPNDTPIAITSAIGPHLSQRPHIYHIPDLPPETQYVAIDLNVGTFPLPREVVWELAWDWIEAEEEPGSRWRLVWMHEDEHHFLFGRPEGYTPDPNQSRRLEVRWE
jgi:uncharacterized membrane protein